MAQDPKLVSEKTFIMPPPPEDARTSLVSNILAIAGFIIVIVVVIWGLVHLAGLSRSWFGSFFGASGESIEITVPETVESGKAFELAWNYEPSATGTYAFLYQCANGLTFRTPSSVGTTNEIGCGAAYTIPADGSKLSLTPTLSGTSSLSIPLSIIFLPSATGTQAEGSASVTVVAKTATTPTPYATPTAPPADGPAPYATPSAAPYPTPVSTLRPNPPAGGPADLSVRIISIVPDSYGAAAVTFDIANIGGTATGIYYFTAQLPTQQMYTYSSPMQASLSPGSHIVNTLRFTQVQQGGGTFSVSLDPSNTVHESNESNNYATQFMSAPYPMYNNYNYNPYQNPNPYVQYYPYAY